MTILLVDDNEVNLFVIEKILHNAGYTNCVSLTSATQLYTYVGLETSTKQPVDLILLDIMMPHIDGIEACKTLKQYDHLKDIPIIFITALEDKKKLAEALDAGGSDYITKPINKTELLARMRAALRLKSELNWHAEQEKKIQYELQLAANVQQNLLSTPIQNEDIQIHVSYAPSFDLAGDMYYWKQLAPNRYLVMLFDMMGHGISASLVCMFISSALRESVRQYSDPAMIMQELNRYMMQLHSADENSTYYFTSILLIVDTDEKTVEYVNAGHPSGYALLDNKLHSLANTTCAIGFFDNIPVTKETLYYEDDLQLLLFTDGVLEAIHPNEFQAEKIVQKIAARPFDIGERSVLDYFVAKEKQTAQKDDMCAIVIQTKKSYASIEA